MQVLAAQTAGKSRQHQRTDHTGGLSDPRHQQRSLPLLRVVALVGCDAIDPIRRQDEQIGAFPPTLRVEPTSSGRPRHGCSRCHTTIAAEILPPDAAGREIRHRDRLLVDSKDETDARGGEQGRELGADSAAAADLDLPFSALAQDSGSRARLGVQK